MRNQVKKHEKEIINKIFTFSKKFRKVLKRVNRIDTLYWTKSDLEELEILQNQIIERISLTTIPVRKVKVASADKKKTPDKKL